MHRVGLVGVRRDFLVESVSAIAAQVNDLFLAYTSAVFAMLGMRAVFFIIDILVELFSLLKYGVAVILVFIGVNTTPHPSPPHPTLPLPLDVVTSPCEYMGNFTPHEWTVYQVHLGSIGAL